MFLDSLRVKRNKLSKVSAVVVMKMYSSSSKCVCVTEGLKSRANVILNREILGYHKVRELSLIQWVMYVKHEFRQ